MSISPVVLSFAFFLLAITLLGVVASFVQHRKSTEDYLVAGRSVPAWLAALSAVATNNSGFMFIGFIAYAYRGGIEAVWMMIGWIVGDWFAWRFVHPKVRTKSEEVEANTVATLIGVHGERTQRPVIVAAGIITFVFLGMYAAAQLKAGSTALETLFGWEPIVGVGLGTVIVVAYCFAGGIRASIWTDAAQSFVMIGGMILLVAVGAMKVGGPAALWANLEQQDPALVQLFPSGLRFTFPLFFLGMVAGGFGAVGQPHILVRFMAIESVQKVRRAKLVYFAWFIPFFIAALLVGLYSRATVPMLYEMPLTEGMAEANAAEYAMPVMARQLLPDILIGLILAGLFSATMSTADSQILVCSGSVTQDVAPQWRESYLASKVATLAVAGLGFSIAAFGDDDVFSLVLDAWSAMGATIGPVLILRLYGRAASTPTALLMMASGLATMIFWINAGLDGDVFTLLPSMIVPFLVYGALRALGVEAAPQIEAG